MLIRPITAGDREAIRELVQQRGTFSAEDIQVALEVVDEALRFPEKDDYKILCAIGPSGELAGYICFGPVPLTDACYDLYWIVVNERSSRIGVGGRLVAAMQQYVAARGGRKIYVDTSSTHPYQAARSFYEKHDYQIVSQLKDFYRVGDHKLIYMKDLTLCTKQAR